MGRPTLLGGLLLTFALLSYEANTASTTVSSTNKPVTSAKSTTTVPSKDTTSYSIATPAPSFNTTPSVNITTTSHSNQTTNSTVSPVPIVNTTTPSPNITTTTHSNHTTNSTVSPVPIVNTTTPSPNITTTTHSNHTTANSTVTPAPIVNTTTPSTNTSTTHITQTTHSANSTTQHITHTTLVPKPTFSPKPSPPTVGNYSVAGDKGADCIMALMGLVLVIHDKEDSFYNVEPAQTKTNGHCASNTANLNITYSGGFINFNFLSDKTSYFVDHIEVLLSPLNIQQVLKQNLLNTKLGSSFQCNSKVNVDLGKQITLTMMNTRLQAFNISHNEFGKESVCSADYRAPVAIAVGITVVVVIILCIISYLIYRKMKLSGYQRI